MEPSPASATPRATTGPAPCPVPIRVLVVEDDVDIAVQVARRLRASGWQVEVVHDGPGAVAAALAAPPDAMVLDVMLPGLDGREVCRRVQERVDVPVLMLTARDSEEDLLAGLAGGADDYMTKPFSMRELVARLAALVRRRARARQAALTGAGMPAGADGTLTTSSSPGVTGTAPDPAAPAPMVLGDVVIDEAARRVSRGGVEAHLTPTEFDLLLRLARSQGQVLSRERLLEEVWGWADPTLAPTRTVDSHVKAVRRKLGPDVVRTAHGVGYAFEPPGPAQLAGPAGPAGPPGPAGPVDPVPMGTPDGGHAPGQV